MSASSRGAIGAVAGAAALVGGSARPGLSQAPKDIVDTAMEAGNFKTLGER